MNVGELIEKLQKFPKDAKVALTDTDGFSDFYGQHFEYNCDPYLCEEPLESDHDGVITETCNMVVL